jgi:hypothetical protein
MLERGLLAAYRRLGPRYPHAALAVLFASAYLIGLVGVALLRLYQDMSGGDLAVIAGAVVLLVVIENVLALRVARGSSGRPGPWLRGDRDARDGGDRVVRAGGLPVDFLSTGRWVAVLFNVVPVALFVTLLLDLTARGLPHPGGRLGGRPRLRRACCASSAWRCCCARCSRRCSCDLPDGADLGGARIPLRWKLPVRAAGHQRHHRACSSRA